MRTASLIIAASLALSPLVLVACSDGADSETAQRPADDNNLPPGNNGGDACENNAPSNNDVCECDDQRILRPRSNPMEFVGLTVSWPIDVDGFLEFTDRIYGDAAANGEFHENYVVQPGLMLSTEADPASNEQVILSLDMETVADNATTRRTVFRAPVSYAYGAVFRDTVAAALTRTIDVHENDPDESEPILLEHRIRSANGGSIDLRVVFEDGRARMEIQTHTPQTSLKPGEVNSPALEGQPFESLAGTVWFHLSIDQFDFFSTRAYGVTAGAAQNFNDFELQPHSWLHLTVTPDLENKLVNVGFEVITLDGRRVAFAKAPASYIAGDQFRENVFRAHRNMMDQVAESGTSSAFEVPFYYDDPEGGGVVQVIAQGKDGDFRIAYSVASPVNYLNDTGFVPYTAELDLPEPGEVEPIATCAELGANDALSGRFLVTFDATDVVRGRNDLDGPLRGDVHGSVFKAEDVSGLGPKEGAQSVANFSFADVDITDRNNLAAYEIEQDLPAGDYQILGFIDIDGNADPENADPDSGDPVTLPIGAYSIRCDVQPTTVEFAITLP